MSESKIEGYFFTAVFIGMLFVVGLMFLPFLGAVAAAIVLATLTDPVHEVFLRYTKRPTLSAFIVTVLVVLAIVLPALGLFMLLLEEVQGISQSVQNLDSGAMPQAIQTAVDALQSALPIVATVDYHAVLQTAFEGIGGTVAGVVTGAADAMFKLVVTILVLFYMLRDGRTFLQGFIELSPLSDDEDVLIVKKLKTVSLSLIRGTMVVATLQGLLTGIGLLLFGVPNPVLWGCIAALTALIPTVGITVVAIPAAIYLGLIGEWAAMLGFIAWSVLFAGTVDNILGPRLIGRSAKIHPMFILLSVLGGLWCFGVAGFIVGPLIFGLVVALSEIYKLKIKAIHNAAEAA